MTHNKVCTHSPHCCGGCDEWFGIQDKWKCYNLFYHVRTVLLDTIHIPMYAKIRVALGVCFSIVTIHGYRCFISNTTVPLQCVALVVRKAYVDRMSFGWLFLVISIKFLPGPYLTNSVLALDQWTFSDISSESRYNFYKDYFAVLKYY